MPLITSDLAQGSGRVFGWFELFSVSGIVMTICHPDACGSCLYCNKQNAGLLVRVCNSKIQLQIKSMHGINIKKKNNEEYIKNARIYEIMISSLLTQRYAILNEPANSELW